MGKRDEAERQEQLEMDEKRIVGWEARVYLPKSEQWMKTSRYTTQSELIDAISRERIAAGTRVRFVRVVKVKRIEAEAVLDCSGEAAFLRFSVPDTTSNGRAARKLGFRDGGIVKIRMVKR